MFPAGCFDWSRMTTHIDRPRKKRNTLRTSYTPQRRATRADLKPPKGPGVRVYKRLGRGSGLVGLACKIGIDHERPAGFCSSADHSSYVVLYVVNTWNPTPDTRYAWCLVPSTIRCLVPVKIYIVQGSCCITIKCFSC